VSINFFNPAIFNAVARVDFGGLFLPINVGYRYNMSFRWKIIRYVVSDRLRFYIIVYNFIDALHTINPILSSHLLLYL